MASFGIFFQFFSPFRFVLGNDGCLCVCCRRLWRTMCVRAANRMIQMPLIDAFLWFVRLFSAAKVPGEITYVIQQVRFDAMVDAERSDGIAHTAIVT